MYKKLEAITKTQHGDLKISRLENFNYSKDKKVLKVYAGEIVQMAAFYPIFFMSDGAGGYLPGTIVGFDKSGNLYLDEKGMWTTPYIPISVRAYPFTLVQSGSEQEGDEITKTFSLCLDVESDCVGTVEGEPLFDEEGKPAKVLQQAKQYMGEMQKMEELTREVCKILQDKDLIVPFNLKIGSDADQNKIEGLFTIDEAKLKQLPDNEIALLMKKDFLKIIYFQMASVGNVVWLVEKFKKQLVAAQAKTLN